MCAVLLSAMTSPGVAVGTVPAPDTTSSGHFPAIKEEISRLSDHVVYRPRDLGGVPRGELGVYLLGNGAYSDDGAGSRMHLQEIASHDYLASQPGQTKADALIAAMKKATAWADFARTGNPSQPGLTWTATDPTRCQTMIFDHECRMADDPEGEARRILLG